MTQFTIRKGPKAERRGTPVQTIEPVAHPVPCALVGADYPGLRPDFAVSEGDRVQRGAPLFVDRRHRAVRFVAAVAGTVARLEFGPRRTLSALVIEPDTDAQGDEALDAKPPAADTPGAVRTALLERGLWPAFRTRPFGRIPDPEAEPAAIFVNAVRQGPLAPDPRIILAERTGPFVAGIDALAQLADGAVHLCQDMGDPLLASPPPTVRISKFGGSAAAGLSGTHIDRLHPVGGEARLWSIGLQDVLAIGHLFETGRYDGGRIVAISGPRAARPRLVRTHLGASLKDLTAGETMTSPRSRPAAILSGPPEFGRPAAYLGRHHSQITITNQNGRAGAGTRPIVPTAALDGALPFATLAVPLMRALSVGDTEAATRLGCLAMIEEDVAALTRLCASGADYGVLLRRTLDTLEGQSA